MRGPLLSIQMARGRGPFSVSRLASVILIQRRSVFSHGIQQV